MAKERVFALFQEYGLGIKQALEQICELEDMGEEDKIEVFYATPPLAYAKYVNKIVNGENPGATISFYLRGIEIPHDQMMNGYGTLTREFSTGETINMRAPQICKLNYKVTIICNNDLEGDILQQQILMGMPFNRNYYFMVNNQYACCYAENPENETTVEAGDGKDKLVRRSLDVVISRAYMEYPIRQIKSFIKEFNLEYRSFGDVNFKTDSSDPSNVVFEHR